MFSSGKLKVETDDGLNFRLLEIFTFTRANGGIIAVPVGTTSDGASTPPAIWATLPPFGRYWRAAFLHDHLYRDTSCDKDYCDSVFLEALASLNVNLIDTKALYEGVHLMGWHAFSEDREEQKTGFLAQEGEIA